ncbi:unnamed protein product [Lymnaea stagnalis]|uniref:Apoptosis regulatory protein Siva n=1 Tax=Lymnaea stagnalis TaxID=6523 RepID=A0AAV2IFF4_LYMST
MPKRNNPFGDHTSLQLKTHVREKEVDRGVGQQIRMQSVYEKTQALLFNGMRHMHEASAVSLDSNDNEMLYADEIIKSDNSVFKQLHLNKNCELIGLGEDSTDMETDSKSCPEPFSFPRSTSKDSEAEKNMISEPDCHRLSAPSFENGFGRTPCEFSPPSSFPPTTESIYEAGPSSASNSVCNAFVHMRHAQSKKSSVDKSFYSSRACHNCRQPVQSRDVMKCQFCENYVCSPCARQCRGCHLHFCQLCSVLNYDQSTERAFCLNCSGR